MGKATVVAMGMAAMVVMGVQVARKAARKAATVEVTVSRGRESDAGMRMIRRGSGDVESL